jgi:hypothetical protein
MKLVLGVVALVAMMGCNMGPENAAATAKCTGVGSRDECKECCSKNGVNRSSWKALGNDTKCTCHDKNP